MLQLRAHMVDGPARAQTLLVASDFDGVLSELAPRHDQAVPNAAALEALHRLGAMPSTRVAVLSGRGCADLQRLLRYPADWLLVGSHGAEVCGEPLPPAPRARIEEVACVQAQLEGIVQAFPGCALEIKPRGVAFHFRAVAPDAEAAVARAIDDVIATHPGLVVCKGSKVTEFLVDALNKGHGLNRLRVRANADSIVFIGDDSTDEDAFNVLGCGDLGVKVGPGGTRAHCRVAGVAEVAVVLASLADAREANLARRRADLALQVPDDQKDEQ